MTIVSTGRSVITYKIGGREYPLITNRNCKVCMSPYRFDIEDYIVKGRVYRKIVEALPEDSGLTVANVKNHYYNNHMPLDVSTTRAITERRAQRVGKSIEEGVESLIDGMTLAETVVQKTFERIASGEIKPDLADGLRAATLLAQMGEYEQSGVDQHAIIEAFIIYHESAQEFMTPEQFEAFGDALESNPVLRSLAARFDGTGGDGETVSGEVVQTESQGD